MFEMLDLQFSIGCERGQYSNALRQKHQTLVLLVIKPNQVRIHYFLVFHSFLVVSYEG